MVRKPGVFVGVEGLYCCGNSSKVGSKEGAKIQEATSVWIVPGVETSRISAVLVDSSPTKLTVQFCCIHSISPL